MGSNGGCGHLAPVPISSGHLETNTQTAEEPREKAWSRNCLTILFRYVCFYFWRRKWSLKEQLSISSVFILAIITGQRFGHLGQMNLYLCSNDFAESLEDYLQLFYCMLNHASSIAVALLLFRKLYNFNNQIIVPFVAPAENTSENSNKLTQRTEKMEKNELALNVLRFLRCFQNRSIF